MKSPFVIISDRSFTLIKKIIDEAERYIKLASFLFYDEKLCDLLIEKRKVDDIEIEVLTTPA